MHTPIKGVDVKHGPNRFLKSDCRHVLHSHFPQPLSGRRRPGRGTALPGWILWAQCAVGVLILTGWTRTRTVKAEMSIPSSQGEGPFALDTSWPPTAEPHAGPPIGVCQASRVHRHRAAVAWIPVIGRTLKDLSSHTGSVTSWDSTHPQNLEAAQQPASSLVQTRTGQRWLPHGRPREAARSCV